MRKSINIFPTLHSSSGLLKLGLRNGHMENEELLCSADQPGCECSEEGKENIRLETDLLYSSEIGSSNWFLV